MTKKCETEDCEDKATCAGLCGACYNWHWNRQNAGVAATQRYRKKIKRIQSRIEALPAPPKKTATASKGRAKGGEARAYH